MKSAGKARNNGLYRHIRTSKEIIRNLLNDSLKSCKNRQYIALIGESVSGIVERLCDTNHQKSCMIYSRRKRMDMQDNTTLITCRNP